MESVDDVRRRRSHRPNLTHVPTIRRNPSPFDACLLLLPWISAKRTKQKAKRQCLKPLLPLSVCLPMWSPPTCPTTQQADLPSLIASIHTALRDAANGKQQAEKVVLEPPVSVKKSITANHLISMEDGRPYKSLKRH
jgi:hypothetical protein